MDKKSILLVEDDKTITSFIKSVLEDEFEVKEIKQEDEILKEVKDAKPTLIIIDYDLKQIDVTALFKRIKRVNPLQKIIMLSDSSNISAAVSVTKLGAADFLSKPVHLENLKKSVRNSILLDEECKLPHLESLADIKWLRGVSSRVKKLIKDLKEVSGGFSDVMLISERGIPLRDLANLIHRNSFNRKRKLVILDLSNFRRESSESHFWVMFSELLSESSGQLYDESEICGTLYLEGFESISLVFQTSILEYISKRKSTSFEGRLDQSKGIIISIFDPENYPKINGFGKIHVPALRERKEDIPLLLSVYINEASQKFGKSIDGIDPKALEFIMLHDFPGNISEFKIFIESAVSAAESNVIFLKDLPLQLKDFRDLFIKKVFIRENFKYAQVREDFERELLELILSKVNWNEERAAHFLDIPKTALSERIAELKLLR